MRNKGQRFGIKWNNQLYEALRVTRSKECIVFSSSAIPIHTTYPKDGRLHMTFKYSTSEDGRVLSVAPDPKNQKRLYASGGRPSFSELEHPVVIETHAGFAERKELSAQYDVVDVDVFNCQQPEIIIYTTPPLLEEVNTIRQAYRGVRRIVKFDDVWVVLWFVDVTQPIKIPSLM